MEQLTGQFEEQDARRVLVVRAIETADARGKVITEEERTKAEQAVMSRLGGEGGKAPEPAVFLAERAGELLHVVESRNPALARLELRDPWWDRLALLLPVIALVAGITSDRLFNWSRTDLLSPPLVGVVVWNLAVYLLLIVSLFAGQRETKFLRWLSEVPSWFGRRAAARVRESVQVQFRLLWWKSAGALESARLHKVMHLSAAAWAVGVVLSIGIAGIATLFKVGWESSFLDAQDVHRVASVMAVPAKALGIEGFTLEQVRQLEFGPKHTPDQATAKRWALIYIVFLLAVVVLPRLLLWAAAAYRVKVAGRAVKLDLSDAYFDEALARVRTANVVISLRGPDSPLKDAALTLLRQAAKVTPQGDRMEVDRSGAPADLVWFVFPSGAAASDFPAHRQNTLVLCERAQEIADLRVQHGAFEALALADCGACWAVERPLHDWLLRHITGGKRPGAKRLVEAWAAGHRQRFAASMKLLAELLAESLSDSQEVNARMPGAKDREAAFTELLGRLQQRLDVLHGRLAELHGVEAVKIRQPIQQRPQRGHDVQQAGAGAAGAVAGALAGAKIDLLTGGLTLGAGMALGAALGGAGVFSAARWWLLGGAVKLGDEQVQSLVDLLVLQYLAVIHAGRARDLGQGDIASDWESETIATVATAGDELKGLAKNLRAAKPDAQDQLQELLRSTTWRVLERLYGREALAVGQSDFLDSAHR